MAFSRSFLPNTTFNFPPVIDVPAVSEVYLKEIQDRFSPKTLSFDQFFNPAMPFLRSNDADHIGRSLYLEFLQLLFRQDEIQDRKLSIGFVHKKLGLVIGDGNIFSLLPEIPADDILLLDMDPTVHFFILNVRNVILKTEEHEDFRVTKSLIEERIRALEMEIYRYYGIYLDILPDKGLRLIYHPMKDRMQNYILNVYPATENLGSFYFLSSRDRFRTCKNALRQKILLPIRGNIFDKEFMLALAIGIMRSNAKISFLYATNVLDFGEEQLGIKNFSLLPLADNCGSLFTKLNRSPLSITIYRKSDAFRKSSDIFKESKQEVVSNSEDIALKEFLKLFPLPIDFADGFLGYTRVMEGFSYEGARLARFAEGYLRKQPIYKIDEIYQKNKSPQFLRFLKKYAPDHFMQLELNLELEIEQKKLGPEIKELGRELKVKEAKISRLKDEILRLSHQLENFHNFPHAFEEFKRRYQVRKRDIFDSHPHLWWNLKEFMSFLERRSPPIASSLWKSILDEQTVKIKPSLSKKIAEEKNMLSREESVYRDYLESYLQKEREFERRVQYLRLA